MKTFVALFRGINVGGRNILPMKDLKSVLEGLGLESVRTYIQSGNVVFQADNATAGLAASIRDAIEQRFGFRPDLIVLTESELEQAISGNPFPEADDAPSTVHLTFLAEMPADPDLASLDAIRASTERFSLGETAFYLHAPDGIGRSKLAARVEKALGVPCTSRNWRTVKRLMQMTQGR